MSKILDLFIINHCNLNCEYCSYDDTIKNSTEINKRFYISLEEIQSKLDILQEYDYINILGGEGTLHPNFQEIVLYLLKNTSAKIRVYSNGLFIATLLSLINEAICYRDRFSLLITFHNLDSIKPSYIKNIITTFKKFKNIKIEFQMIYNERDLIRLSKVLEPDITKNIFIGYDIYKKFTKKDYKYIKKHLNIFDLKYITLFYISIRKEIVISPVTDIWQPGKSIQKDEDHSTEPQFCLIKELIEW